jgi:hypothetical protein
MAHKKAPAPARTVDWDAISQRGKDDILQALTGDQEFMASENGCE